MLHNQKGFTLIESLIVLSIFLLISSITAFSLKPQYHSVNEKAFISQLKADLYYGQQYAIANQMEVKVIFYEHEHMYFLSADSNRLVERFHSPKISVSQATIPLYFKFLPSGNIDRFGSLLIRSERKIYRLTLLIGKGRFYVTED
jgi:competence protein ComGD